MKSMIDQQTIADLEFDAIRHMLAESCHAKSARQRMEVLEPLPDLDQAEESLLRVSELAEIRNESKGFPRLECEELDLEIQRLSLKGTVLDLDGLIRLLDASRLVNDVLAFLKGKDSQYPQLCALTAEAYVSTAIIAPIERVLDPRLQVKDDASTELKSIRLEIRRTRNEINKNFEKAMRKLARDGYLADTVEAYINDRRVLSVLSSHKRQVQGNVVGTSNTGNFTYIEPRENMLLNNELEMLLDDERTEIRRIFMALTNELRTYLPLISAYQHIIVEMDFIQAKLKLAHRMDGAMPTLQEEPVIELIRAYHPLLLINNKSIGRETSPQSLYMDKFCRMMVISGPNAGGKSITLKTVGLLQIMVQCGLLVPCDPSSRFGWFHSVLSDIGDNQSIANQLSTYSYRLKRMKYFLETANKRTLLLLDEFGTGSDPELGGALAEVFFETLYNKKCFGVITTHYANIKLKASRLRNAVNASMLFNRESLEPMFQLSVGQPGSSFTFEVAAINGIPHELIEDAKTRLDASKVEMDNLIAGLQKEKSEMETLNQRARDAELRAAEAREEADSLIEHYEQRLLRQQKLIEENNRDLNFGKKVDQFIHSYRLKGHNKALMEEVRKFLAIEKSKLVKKKQERSVKKSLADAKPAHRPKPRTLKPSPPALPVVPGSKVRMHNGNQTGEVKEIKGELATVLFGNFKTHVKVVELEVV